MGVPWKIKHLKKVHGKYKLNKITNISQQFIQLEQVTEELLTFCSVIYSNLSKKDVFTLHTSN